MPLVSAELVHFNLSLSSFFVFSFAWPFCIIPGIYNYSLDKFISPINYVVTRSPKSQNNSLIGSFSLQPLPRSPTASTTPGQRPSTVPSMQEFFTTTARLATSTVTLSRRCSVLKHPGCAPLLEPQQPPNTRPAKMPLASDCVDARAGDPELEVHKLHVQSSTDYDDCSCNHSMC